MRQMNLTRIQMAALGLGIASLVACSSSGTDGDGGKGGDGGTSASKSGGKGGSKSGGSGGSKSSGGSGGSKSTGGTGGGSAGSGGSSTGGSAGGKGGSTGGSMAGSGGSAGAGGTAGGGAGGVKVNPPIEGPGVIWSGKVMTDVCTERAGRMARCTEKMVAGDVTPGYIHATTGDPQPIVEVDVPELKALGIKYALSVDVMMAGMTNFAFNYRMDVPTGTGFAWNYFDASAFAGISFWAKSEGAARVFFSATSYDSNSIGTAETSTGSCTKPTRAECGPSYVQPAVVNPTWARVVMPFAKFVPAMDPKAMGRVDMWTAGNFKMLVTGLTFVTAAQL